MTGSGNRSRTGAIVLAAGPGTRLGVMGTRMAKTMIPVAGRPFLEHLTGRLLGAGLFPVVVAVNHHADTIIRYFTDHPLVTGMRFAHTDRAGTGADLMKCLPHLHSDTFIVWNGDTIASLDIDAFRDHAAHHTGRAVIALSRRPDVPNRDAWYVQSDGTITATMEARPAVAPPADYSWRGSSTGIVHLDADQLARFHSGYVPDLYSGILPDLITRREVVAFDNGYRYLLDFGTCATLARLDHTAVTGWNPTGRHPRAGTRQSTSGHAQPLKRP